MKTKIIPSRWLADGGRRLDPGPYLSGAIEAKEALRALPVKKVPLSELTKGFSGGIYNGPQFSRNYVESADHGVPFLGSSSMLLADLSHLPWLRKRDAESPKLGHLRIEEGMTLISCSGTVGRMVFARPDMAGMWSSQHIMKVVPDPDKIPPGYLYAFLSSRFGVPMVTAGTYGAIIQHIEPEHVSPILIPRLLDEVEKAIESKIESAAHCLSRSQRLYQDATARLLTSAGLTEPEPMSWGTDEAHLGWASPRANSESFRAMNYDPRCAALDSAIRRGRYDHLGEVVVKRLFKGKIIFRRIDSDPEFGWRLVGQREAFRLRPEGRFIASRTVKHLGLRVPAWSVMIPSHGTLGEQELYCRSILVTERCTEYAYSGDFFRCVPDTSKIDGCYLFAFIRSELAFRLLRGISIGAKQQEQHIGMMRRFPIPRLAPIVEASIAALVLQGAREFDRALKLEEEAWEKLERALRRGVANGNSFRDRTT